MPRQTAGYVYLIQAGELYRFKIGCAQNVKRRLAELQTSSPLILNLLGEMKSSDMYDDEKRWHQIFHSTRKIGEWFDLTHEQLSQIATEFRAKIGIHFSKRTKDSLVIGQEAYISWDSRDVTKVTVVAFAENGQDGVLIKRTNGWESWWLYHDEVRESAVSALFNRVTM